MLELQSVYIASKNRHKVDEFQQLLVRWGVRARALPPEVPDSPETGDSFAANAMQKAAFYGDFCEGWILSDDSGLCVPVLGGEPGVHSARYAGRHGDDAANRRLLLERLSGYTGTERRAVFVCVLTAWHGATGVGLTVRGELHGEIADSARGTGGFGYDPLFYVPALGATLAEVPAEVKNAHSHRSAALNRLMRLWREATWDAPVRGQ